MTRFGHAQVLGFAEDVASVLEKERTSLAKAGVDSAAVVAQIKMLHDQTVALNAQQESLKRQLQETTATYEATRERLYVVSSGGLDMGMAAVGKTSASARNMQRLRSRVRRPRGAAVVLPVAPPAG